MTTTEHLCSYHTIVVKFKLSLCILVLSYEIIYGLILIKSCFHSYDFSWEVIFPGDLLIQTIKI